MLYEEPEEAVKMVKQRGVAFILKPAVGRLRDIPTKKFPNQNQSSPVNDSPAPVASKPPKGKKF